ncbi:ABC transporter ATP-binding protein [Brevibacterium sp. FME37]|nr:ABC transporter ATP-binding protein [Brevibacterium sp. FME37]
MLEFADVDFQFRRGSGVSDLSFHVDPGEVVAVIGLNGAGKTTLMRLALGMLRPDAGSVRLFGALIADASAASWALVGALIEVPLAYPELTVEENLRISCRLHGGDPARVEAALDTWKLTSLAGRRFRRLSLGNRQRTGLAAALQHHPKMIVLDEPSNALDPASVIMLRKELALRAKHGAAILVSSHHLDEVARVADRVLLMNRGRLLGQLDTTGADLERAFFDRIAEDDERYDHIGQEP